MSSSSGYVVVVDICNLQIPIEGTTPQQYTHLTLAKGDPVPDDLPKKALDVALKQGGIAKDGDAVAIADAMRADDEAYPAGEEGDAAIAALKAEDLVAYVGQFPDERERVWKLEQAHKGGPRKSVAGAAGYDPDTGEAIPLDPAG